MNANLTNAERKEIYRRDGFRCALCDSESGIQIHHIIPRGQGGSSSQDNLITLCSYCHAQVHGIIMYDQQITPDDMEQLIVEYMADLYPGTWNPYKAGRHPFDYLEWPR